MGDKNHGQNHGRKIWGKTALMLVAGAIVAGCGALPSSGPYAGAVTQGAGLVYTKQAAEKKTAPLYYVFADISAPVSGYLAATGKEGYGVAAAWPQDSALKDIRISVNDTVQVTIYESQSGGLFIPSEAGVRPGNYVTIPEQMVDSTGMIDVPFAGRVRVVGRAPTDVAEEITEKLGSRAIEPQAIVAITRRQGAEVSVIGAVRAGGRFPIGLNGDRVLDGVARAGGPSVSGHELRITLQRGKKEWTATFDSLVMDPKNNVYLHPGDTLYLFREPETFQVFGAGGFQGAHPFPRRDVTMAEALGIAGGLVDNRADPAEVYIYRRETAQRLSGMGIDLPETVAAETAGVPVVYRLNLRDPEGFFFAQRVPVLDKDVIYIANAESVEMTKFLDLVGLTSGTKITGQNAVEQ